MFGIENTTDSDDLLLLKDENLTDDKILKKYTDIRFIKNDIVKNLDNDGKSNNDNNTLMKIKLIMNLLIWRILY